MVDVMILVMRLQGIWALHDYLAEEIFDDAFLCDDLDNIFLCDDHDDAFLGDDLDDGVN